MPVLGKIHVFATEKGICAIFLRNGESKGKQFLERYVGHPILYRGLPGDLPVREALEEYMGGKRTSFNFPLHFLMGTPFMREVWKVLISIPYGQCVSYQWIAAKVGRPRAARAVGNANAQNPIPIIVPCHRVIRKNGALGGFSSGLSIKRALLAIEGCDEYKDPA